MATYFLITVMIIIVVSLGGLGCKGSKKLCWVMCSLYHRSWQGQYGQVKGRIKATWVAEFMEVKGLATVP
jgi:hypothetical protein